MYEHVQIQYPYRRDKLSDDARAGDDCVWIVATPFACAEELHPQVIIWCFLFSSSRVRLHGRGERFIILQISKIFQSLFL